MRPWIAYENVVCNVAAMLSRHQWVDCIPCLGNDSLLVVNSSRPRDARTRGRPMGPAEQVPWGYWLEQLQNNKMYTTVRQNTYSDPACPIVRALRSAHFAIYINTTRVVTALLLQGRNLAVMTFQITGPLTGSGNGLAPNRRQAITWTNETSPLSHWRRNHL